MKITLKDGSVFEGTAQEYAELVKLGEGIARTEEGEVPNFEVGDYVVALPSADENYSITTTEMQLGEIRDVKDDYIDIKIVAHSTRKGYTGDTLSVESKHFRKATDEEVAKIKNEYIPKEGDIVVITGNTNGSINKVGDIGRVSERLGNKGVQVRVPGKPNGLFGGNYTRFDEMRPATEEEKKQYEQAEKFAKLGRKPGEFKKGDIVRVKWLLGKGDVDEIAEIKSGPEGVGCGGNYKLNDGNKESLGEDLELIAPVESRVDRVD